MRRHAHTILGGCVIVLAAAAGCYTGPGVGASGAETTTETSPTETAAAEVVSDLPCDVASVLASACTSCHGTTLTDGARHPLLSRADLAAPLGSDPSRTIADLAVARMKDETAPMPPTARAPKNANANAIAILEKWIAAGMPEGTCSALGIDYATEPVCTSKKKWTRGDTQGDEMMNPGEPCISCHTQESAEGEIHAKIYAVAGTIYPTAHEPDDCNGLDGTKSPKAKVIITDATGATFTLPVNAAGNFFSETKMKKPLRAKVQRGDRVYEMQSEIKEGDCNACHTEAGRAEEGAEYPRGRIVSP